MGCECYQIGGRFIAEDPDCPAHGTLAQELEREREEDERLRDQREQQMRARIEELEEIVRNMRAEIQQLRDTPTH